MPQVNQAVFLSYASQDVDAATRICEALQRAGLEVWFDKSELRGGDAWDQKIRRQIRECALFVPLISATTNSRAEGYFRLEWKLAVDRSYLLADDHPFLFPIMIDEVAEATARVPDRFRDFQWTRLRLDETPNEIAARVSRMLHTGSLSAEPPLLSPPPSSRRQEAAKEEPADRKKKKHDDRPVWLKHGWSILALAFAAYYFIVQPAIRELRRGSEPATPPAATRTASREGGDEAGEADELVRQARALLANETVSANDLEIAEKLIRRARAQEATNAEVWAAQAEVDQAFEERGFDRSEKRRESALKAADRALRLDPQSFEARLVEARLRADQAGDPQRWQEALRKLAEERPADERVLRALKTLGVEIVLPKAPEPPAAPPAEAKP